MLEFISLTELGVGSILVRHTEIVLIEPTPCWFSKIQLSTGASKIVEESPICILTKINAATEFDAAVEVKQESTVEAKQS